MKYLVFWQLIHSDLDLTHHYDGLLFTSCKTQGLDIQNTHYFWRAATIILILITRRHDGLTITCYERGFADALVGFVDQQSFIRAERISGSNLSPHRCISSNQELQPAQLGKA